MSEISNSNREAERQRIEQMEREQRKAEEDRIQQERENSKELQAEEFSLSEDKDVAEDKIVESVAESSVSFDSLENEVFSDDYYVEDTEFLDSYKYSVEEAGREGVSESAGYRDSSIKDLETDADESCSLESRIDKTRGEQEAIKRDYLGKGELSEKDKKELSDRQYEHLKDVPKEERDDCMVYESNAIKSVKKDPLSERCDVIRDWKDGSDGAKEGTEHAEIIQKGSVIDRYGPPTGKWASPLKEDGSPYSTKERATGDRLIEPNIEDNSAYHRYEINQDLSKDNIQSTLDQKYEEGILNEKEYERYCMKLESYYEDSRYFEEQSEGIKTSIACEQFEHGENPDGGAKQYEFPFTIDEMERLELISTLDDYE